MDDDTSSQPENPTARLDDTTQPLTHDDGTTHPTAAADPAAAAASPARRPGRRRTLLIGAGAAAALLVVGGGAFAVGAAVGDDADDRPGVHRPGGDDHDDHDDERPERAQAPDDDRDDAQDARAAQLPDADADALRTAAQKAIAEVDGEGVTGIDVERGGYDIEVRRSDGTDVDVFVAVDGAVRTERDGDADADADPLLDLDRLGDILTAAQSAASDAGAPGDVESLSTGDSTDAAYEIDLRADDGRDVDVDLDADLSVVRVDAD